MISLALIGKNISHSRSPEIYRELLNQEIEYRLFDCEFENQIPTLDFIFEKYQGLSITSPYKKYFLNKVSVLPGFQELNAINAIRKTGSIFEAINTDYLAIQKILNDFKPKKVILLGDGSMSSITQKILNKMGTDFKIISRKRNGPFEGINLSKEFYSETNEVLIINSCSRDFVFNGYLPENSIFWDFNYDFFPHLSFFSTKKVKYIDGLGLLKLQAKFALEFFRF